MTGDLILKPQPYPITGNTHKAISYNTTRSIFLSRKEGGSMETDLDMNGNFILNVKDPINSDHGVNKKYVDNLSNTKLDKLILKNINLNNKQLKNLGYNINDPTDVVNLGFTDQKYLQKVSDSDLNMDEHRVVNSLDPINSRDLANKNYVDRNFFNRLTGGQIGGDIDMRGNTIKFLKLDNADSAAARVAELKLKVSKSGDTMSGNLNMNNNLISNLKTPTGDNDAVNKGYLNQKIRESRVQSSDKSNVFKYLNDPNQTSSERNVTVNSFGDWVNSPHKFNNRAYDVTLKRFSGADSYDSKIGINLYSAGAGKFTLVFEFHSPTTVSEINITASAGTAVIIKQTQQNFNNHTKVIVQVDNSSLQTPDYLYFRIQGKALQANVNSHIIVYGVNGLVNSVESETYDDVYFYLNENFEDENGDMKIKKDVNLDNHKITNLKEGINDTDAVNKLQLNSVSYFTNNHTYRDIFHENFYDLIETSTFNINKNSYGVVIFGVKPNLHLGTNRYLSNYDRIHGMKMSNGHILLKNNINQSTSFTLFFSIYFSEDIVIKFAGDSVSNNGYYPFYSMTKSNNRINIHESSHISYHSVLTGNFKNKKIMLWICFNSSRNLYKFGISNFSSHIQTIINNPMNFETKILRILYSGYVNKIGFVERFIDIDSLDHHRVILEEMRNGSYFE